MKPFLFAFLLSVPGLFAAETVYNYNFYYQFNNPGECPVTLTGAYFSNDGTSWQGFSTNNFFTLQNGPYVVPGFSLATFGMGNVGFGELSCGCPIYFRFLYTDGHQNYDTGNAGGGSFSAEVNLATDHSFLVLLSTSCNTNHPNLSIIYARDKSTGQRKIFRIIKTERR